MKVYLVIVALLGTVLPALAYAADTASCEGKRGWQRSIVQSAVHRWFTSEVRPDDLLELIQAEHGIAACASGLALPLRLHTTMLSRGLALDQLGAVLLANELEWSGLIPRPEEGLAGAFFRVELSPQTRDSLAPALSSPARQIGARSASGMQR